MGQMDRLVVLEAGWTGYWLDGKVAGEVCGPWQVIFCHGCGLPLFDIVCHSFLYGGACGMVVQNAWSSLFKGFQGQAPIRFIPFPSLWLELNSLKRLIYNLLKEPWIMAQAIAAWPSELGRKLEIRY